MFILSFPMYLLSFIFVLSFVRGVTSKGFDHKATDEYFNVVHTGPVRFVLYAAYAYLSVWALSILVFPLAAALPFIHLVVLVLSWFWLVETIKAGYAARWVSDLKDKLTK